MLCWAYIKHVNKEIKKKSMTDKEQKFTTPSISQHTRNHLLKKIAQMQRRFCKVQFCDQPSVNVNSKKSVIGSVPPGSIRQRLLLRWSIIFHSFESKFFLFLVWYIHTATCTIFKFHQLLRIDLLRPRSFQLPWPRTTRFPDTLIVDCSPLIRSACPSYLKTDHTWNYIR